MKQWYETLFENYAHSYDKESFTQGTIGECDFIEEEINFNKSYKILDVGCGTGRHAIELSKRGYDVTGIDLSESQLKRAREKASEQKLDIDFQLQDARELEFSREFDLVIMICEGGFSLMETDDMNYQILQSISRTLKPHGKLIFTTLNALFPLSHSAKDLSPLETKDGNATYENHSFDLITLRDHNTTRIVDDYGNEITLESNERYYMPSEITWLLKSLGFSTIEVFGCKLGNFSREDNLTRDDFEMLVIAEKNDMLAK